MLGILRVTLEKHFPPKVFGKIVFNLKISRYYLEYEAHEAQNTGYHQSTSGMAV
jgi:hypothetical protein